MKKALEIMIAIAEVLIDGRRAASEINNKVN
ncbi:hypothetical protein JOD45_002520 [Scopulibacillus daqui]|uniref:Uncharacterized protein n=1 Tax=Scopulibacillus daqui TaxID=1469162 RepID=A0ABS2Q1Y4_9BACL|nr:hypothetical protein [Scopulibacillus daqui]